MNQNIVEPVSFPELLPRLCENDLLGKTREQVREFIGPLISFGSGVYSLTQDLPYNKRQFIAVQDIETGEQLIDAEFKNGLCIGLALSVPTDYLDRCARKLRETGWIYKSGVKRWTKRGLQYAWRAQQSEKDRHLLTCRRLLPSKVHKSV